MSSLKTVLVFRQDDVTRGRLEPDVVCIGEPHRHVTFADESEAGRDNAPGNK